MFTNHTPWKQNYWTRYDRHARV